MTHKVTIVLFFVLTQTINAQQFANNTAFNRTNSPYDELNPVMGPDGKTLFFTIANHPSNVGGKKDPGDIWYSQLADDQQWSEPVHAGTILNDRGYNGIAGFSLDGKEMFLLSHYSTGNPVRTQGISVSRYSTGWSRPENISVPYFQNKSGWITGFVSPDKKYFVFSAESYETYGVEDIYISLRNDQGKWTEPRNVGSKINTQFQELCPSLSADGRTLYFSSNGRKGKGSFDVFSATRLDDSWTNWSDPVNLGEPVNTEGRDLFYRIYPSLGFSLFTSTENSDRYGNLRIFRPEKLLPADSAVMATQSDEPAIKITEQTSVPADEKVVTIHGKVLNSKTGEAILAKVTFEVKDDSAGETLYAEASVAKGYSLGIPSVNNYTIVIKAPGFISAHERLDIKTYEMKDLEMNFRLQPIEVGTTVNLKDVLFEQSKTILLPQSYAELDLVVAFLKDNPNVRIELAGHTDNRGIASQNLKLSQERVERVKAYLVSKGIDRKRITGKGYGGTKPIASNDAEETRQLNRRVEFTIKKY